VNRACTYAFMPLQDAGPTSNLANASLGIFNGVGHIIALHLSLGSLD